MGASSSRQDEDMFLAMLSPSQKARLLKKKSPSSPISSSSQRKNALQKSPQKRPPKGQIKDEPRKKQNIILPPMLKGSLTPTKLTQSSFPNTGEKLNSGTQSNALIHTRAPTVLCNDGLYADFSFFAFRPAEIAHDFYILDMYNHGSISRRILGMALAKQFTKFSVVCSETLYRLSATVEDLLFIWEYVDFGAITCEVYVLICYLFYRLPKIRGFPCLVSYYLHDINYSQCLSIDAFINSLTTLYDISNIIIKDKVREYEKSRRALKKNTYSEDDFVYVCNSLKAPAKKKNLIDHYLLKLRSLDSLPLLTAKYRLDSIALTQPGQSTSLPTDHNMHNTIGAALTYFYSISGTVYDDCTLTINNLKEFNRIRTKDFIFKIFEEYQSYVNNINPSKSPLAKLSVTERNYRKDKGNEEWSSTSSGSAIEVFSPLFKMADSDINASTLRTLGEKGEKLDTAEAESLNTPLDPTMKISLCLNIQDALSETQSVICSFEVDSSGQLQRMKALDDKERSGIHKDNSATVGDSLSHRLAMIATVHVAKGYAREMDFEGDNEVIVAKSGSFCAYRDADKLQIITQFPGL